MVLKTEGDATELDKGLIERIVDPLTHLVRNSVDHGIETPDERVAPGNHADEAVCSGGTASSSCCSIPVTPGAPPRHSRR